MLSTPYYKIQACRHVFPHRVYDVPVKLAHPLLRYYPYKIYRDDLTVKLGEHEKNPPATLNKQLQATLDLPKVPLPTQYHSTTVSRDHRRFLWKLRFQELWFCVVVATRLTPHLGA